MSGNNYHPQVKKLEKFQQLLTAANRQTIVPPLSNETALRRTSNVVVVVVVVVVVKQVLFPTKTKTSNFIFDSIFSSSRPRIRATARPRPRAWLPGCTTTPCVRLDSQTFLARVCVCVRECAGERERACVRVGTRD